MMPLQDSLPLTFSLLARVGPTIEIPDFDTSHPSRLLESIAALTSKYQGFPPYLLDLVRLELLRYGVLQNDVEIPADVGWIIPNPTLDLEKLQWDFSEVLDSNFTKLPVDPAPGDWWVMAYRHPSTQEVVVRAATARELLALKLVADGGDWADKAAEAGTTLGALDQLVLEAAEEGFLLRPESRIRRRPDSFSYATDEDWEDFLVSDVFTIQWHITNECELQCRHCYDRTLPSPLTLEDGLRVLNDLRAFCLRMGVYGHVCFTGGNPLLHPSFFDLYRAATDLGFSTSILGNPTSRSVIERICNIQKPTYYQVSLEGLQEHNDAMRGKGHFERVSRFLDVLREFGIESQVMLTLTRDNMDQVIPLAELLRDKVDGFTFNRLAQVGNGQDLPLPEPEEYRRFLEAYVEVSSLNPVLAWKDNLLNIVRDQRGMGPFGGCTGFGCGAAFNFVAILPDGRVHACRKFPSPIGEVPRQTLYEIYHSSRAERYRRGPAACSQCRLRPVCGGCMAVVHGYGLDPFNDRDPMCFFRE